MLIRELREKIRENVAKVIVGKESTVDLLIVAMLAGGHVLLEDVPGTGKTMLTKAFAMSIGGSYSRVQFTPDLLPTDLTGVNVYRVAEQRFEFSRGPVFAHVLLADEINRATPKTQSGLLECMEEGQVTVDGESYRLPDPFMVIATQNPVESLGTFPLPEAQLDRFLMRGRMDYPTREETVEILRLHGGRPVLSDMGAVVTTEDIGRAREELINLYVCPDLMTYIAELLEATRTHPRVLLGASPRAGLALLKSAKGYAAIAGRDHLLPDDIKIAAVPVLAHRLVLDGAATVRHRAAERVIEEILASVPVPTEAVLRPLP